MADKSIGTELSPQEVLGYIPQQRPFRFVDEIEEISATHVVGSYTYRHDEFFFTGHFPGRPITPGVILVETMAQLSVVALGIYNYALTACAEDLPKYFAIASELEGEFFEVVRPGDRVIVRAERVYWRRLKIKANAQMTFPDGTLVATSTSAGVGVKHG